MNYHVPTAAECAAALERYARAIAPTVAVLVAAAVHVYWAGYRLGRAVHAASDWLAAHWPTRPTEPAPAPLPAPAPAPAPLPAPAPAPADPLADRIRSLRAAGLSQRAIAERVGVSRATVRRRLAAA